MADLLNTIPDVKGYLSAVCSVTHSDYGEIWKVAGLEPELTYDVVCNHYSPVSENWYKQLQICLPSKGADGLPNVIAQLVLGTVCSTKDLFWANTPDVGGLVPGSAIKIGTIIGLLTYVDAHSQYILLLFSHNNMQPSIESKSLIQGLALSCDRKVEDLSIVDDDIVDLFSNPFEDEKINCAQVFNLPTCLSQPYSDVIEMPPYFHNFFPPPPPLFLFGNNEPDFESLQKAFILMPESERQLVLQSHCSSADTNCKVKSCNESSAPKSAYCLFHSNTRKCNRDGCNKCSQGGTKYCISHGGGRRCKFEGCSKGARDKNFCTAHGGGRRCDVQDCNKAAVGGSVKCTTHGGGRRCQHENCQKSAQSATNFCVRHGGGKRCDFPECSKVARGRTPYCAGHGGGNRCQLAGCNRISFNNQDKMCRIHRSSTAKKAKLQEEKFPIQESQLGPFPEFLMGLC